MTVIIDTDIPIPNGGGTKEWVEKVAGMEVGHSCFIEGRTSNDAGYCNRKLGPKKFKGRTRTENNIAGVRIWRIE